MELFPNVFSHLHNTRISINETNTPQRQGHARMGRVKKELLETCEKEEEQIIFPGSLGKAQEGMIFLY